MKGKIFANDRVPQSVQYDSLDMFGYIHVCMHAHIHDHACLRNSKSCEKYMHNIYTCMDAFLLI